MTLSSVSVLASVMAASAQYGSSNCDNHGGCCNKHLTIAEMLQMEEVQFCRAYLADKGAEKHGEKFTFDRVCFEGNIPGAADPPRAPADIAKYLGHQDKVAKNSFWNTQGMPHDFPPKDLNEVSGFSDSRDKTGYFADAAMCTGLWYPSDSTIQVGSGDAMISNNACGVAGSEMFCADVNGKKCEQEPGTAKAGTADCICAHPWMAAGDVANTEVPARDTAPWCWKSMYQLICGGAFPLVYDADLHEGHPNPAILVPSCYLDCRNTMMWCNRLDPESELGQRILDYQGMNSDSGFESMYVVPGYCEYWRATGPDDWASIGQSPADASPNHNDEFFANQFRTTPPPGTVAVGDKDEDGPCAGVSAAAGQAPALLASLVALVAVALALH